jgi:hypothetical protein
MIINNKMKLVIAAGRVWMIESSVLSLKTSNRIIEVILRTNTNVIRTNIRAIQGCSLS